MANEFIIKNGMCLPFIGACTDIGICNGCIIGTTAVAPVFKYSGSCNSITTILGNNSASGQYSFNAGGICNAVGGLQSVALGGCSNFNFGCYSTVTASCNSCIPNGRNVFIAAGSNNRACGVYATIIGGTGNTTSESNYAAIIGGANNTICGVNGKVNILGGSDNVINSSNSSIINGSGNYIDGFGSTMIGGYSNSIYSVNQSTITNSSYSRMLSPYIAGIHNSIHDSAYSCICSGANNTVINSYNSCTYYTNCSAIIGARYSRVLYGPGIVLGGTNNCALGSNSLVLGGISNSIEGNNAAVIGCGIYSALSNGLTTNQLLATNLTGGATNICVDLSGIIIRDTSDYRLKTNIQPLTCGLETISYLNPVSFSWCEQYVKSRGAERQIGFIAQEVQGVVPAAVSKGKEDGFYSFDPGKIVPVLTKAVQELQAENNELKLELQEIKAILAKNNLS